MGARRRFGDLRYEWRRFQTIALRADVARAQLFGDREAVVEDVVEISRLANDSRRWSDGQRYSREAIQMAKSLGNSSLEARAQFQLGLALIGTGDYAEALTTFHRAMPALERDGDPKPLAAVLLNLGLVNDRLGRASDAATMWRQAAKVAQSAADNSQLCTALIDLGSLAFANGQLEAAGDYWSEALTIARELKDVTRIAKVAYCLGVIAFREGRLAEADRFMTESHALHRRLGRHDLASRAEEYLVSLRPDEAR